jgi:uncharacterized membrane protein YgcG
MSFTAADVGPRVVDGREFFLSETEKQAIADEWNINQLAQAEATMLARRQPSVLDVIAVLTAEQQTALTARLTEEAMP